MLSTTAELRWSATYLPARCAECQRRGRMSPFTAPAAPVSSARCRRAAPMAGSTRSAAAVPQAPGILEGEVYGKRRNRQPDWPA
eukprot:CAMPEP_0175242454 /NCGR_PEP_ID=MMETSP0093-20121207/31074_1 /TAXON_ID=311494 /ORGANISM="Alexandrium monilatum, Strain CCMP3105" /LENGTH=83 /DNA_ID=CAMNT_0016536525 /DNA_START=37 /DNA_END=284 /DNA_ORIENTATION=+